MALSLYIVYELRTWKTKSEINRQVFNIAIIGAGAVALYGPVKPFLYAVLAFHATTYLGLMGVALKKSTMPKRNIKSIYLRILGISLIYGGFMVFGFTSFMQQAGVLQAAKWAFWVSSSLFFCHVIYDTYLWRSSHPSAKMIYS